MSVPAAPLTADDVILCSGGSGALEMALTALVGEGDNVLVPRPGFPLYQVGVRARVLLLRSGAV